MDRRLIAVVELLNTAGLDRVVKIHRGDHVQRMSGWTGCCCVCSSIRFIIAARRTRC
jgi:hypothetical protein